MNSIKLSTFFNIDYVFATVSQKKKKKLLRKNYFEKYLRWCCLLAVYTKKSVHCNGEKYI